MYPTLHPVDFGHCPARTTGTDTVEMMPDDR